MNIQHLGMLVRLKKYLDELLEATAARGPMSMLDRKLVVRCNNNARSLLAAIEELEAEIDRKLAARKTT